MGGAEKELLRGREYAKIIALLVGLWVLSCLTI